MRVASLLSGLVLAAALASAALAAPAFSASRPDVYLLTGQSNMSGRGLLEELTAEEKVADPTIRLYGNDETFRPALEPLDDAAGQIDGVSADVQAAVGPGLFFARATKGLHRRPILLVPCAKGGSSIDQWKPSLSRDSLYGSCLARAKAVGGRVRGVLWYQGESDAARPASGEVWREAFERLAGHLRGDLAQPHLPIVIVQLADPPSPAISAPKTYPGWAAIQAVQAGTLPNCVAMVSAKGLAKKADDLHLTTASQRVLGGRLAEAMERLRRQRCH